jgi:hypothetical protein
MLDESRPRTLAVGSDRPGHLGDGTAVARNRFEQLDDTRLTLALEQSMAPSPCSRMARPVNEALWPPTQTKERGRASLVTFAKSTISGTLAR